MSSLATQSLPLREQLAGGRTILSLFGNDGITFLHGGVDTAVRESECQCSAPSCTFEMAWR